MKSINRTPKEISLIYVIRPHGLPFFKLKVFNQHQILYLVLLFVCLFVFVFFADIVGTVDVAGTVSDSRICFCNLRS